MSAVDGNFIVGIARCNEPDDIFEQTIASIATSSRLPTRVVIIDNGDVPLARSALSPLPVNALIDRCPENLGCAASWNLLLRWAFASPDRPTPIILNADTAVAPDTLAKMMVERSPTCILAYGFGCFRLDEEVFAAVGDFDEGFYPCYCEDVDYRHRMKLLGITPVEWPIFPALEVAPGRLRAPTGIVHGKHQEVGYQGWSGEKAAWFAGKLEENKARYVRKWGGTPYEEKYSEPFNGR